MLFRSIIISYSGAAVHNSTQFITNATGISGTNFRVTSGGTAINFEVKTGTAASLLYGALVLNNYSIPTLPPYTQSKLTLHDYVNDFTQINVQNQFVGNTVSSDFVATANTGDNANNFVDLGINGSVFTGTIGYALDSYLYASNKSFWIGLSEDNPNNAIKF